MLPTNDHTDNRPLEMFLDDFVSAIREDIIKAEKSWGDGWKDIPTSEHLPYLAGRIANKLVQPDHDWESIAGYALIGWLRTYRSDLFRK